MGIYKKRKDTVPYLFTKRHYVYENRDGDRKPYLIMIREVKRDDGPDICGVPIKKR